MIWVVFLAGVVFGASLATAFLVEWYSDDDREVSQ